MIVEDLPELMRAAGATSRGLSEVSGVCERTICNARAGGHVSKVNHFCILEALRTKTFQRDRRGGEGRKY